MGRVKDYLTGPKIKTPIPDCSLAEFFIPMIRAHPKGNILQVDAVTGYAETSRQVLEKSLKVTEGLRKLGLGQDDVFCLISWNSSDVYASVLGIWWLGGVLAPLDPEWKALELASMFERLKPTVVISEPRVLDQVIAGLKDIGWDAKIIVLDEKHNVKDPHIPFEELLKCDVDVDTYKPLPVKSPATKAALVSPTSGSTGRSKGAALSHRSIIFQTLAILQTGILSDCKSVMVTSHFYWISCTSILIISLSTGANKIYMNKISINNIALATHKFKPELCVMGSDWFSQVLKHPEMRKCDLTCFRRIILGGSMLKQVVLDDLKNVGTHFNMVNVYGTSETGILTSTEDGGDVLAVGRPVAETKVKIVDPETGRTLGPNECGELVTSSPAVMLGYVGLEKETRAAVVDGWYHTGDLAYYTESEIIYVVGRLKDVIKDSWNNQISPTEIEGLIESLPGVMEAGIVGMPRGTDQFYLVGLVVPKAGATVTEEEVINIVKDNMAAYKHLEKVKFVEAIPRTNVGKVKRKVLQEMAESLFR